MSESLDDFLTDDHNRLDELIAAFQERKNDNPLDAAGFLAEFTAGLLRRLVWLVPPTRAYQSFPVYDIDDVDGQSHD